MESSRKQALVLVYIWLFASSLPAVEASYETGDLIFRSAKGFISEIARNFSTHDKRFSHVGMIYIENHQSYVIHTLEDDHKKIKTTVKESLRGFLNDAILWQVYRLPITKKEQFWIEFNIKREIKLAKPFDFHFDLRTNDSYYCTELIWNILKNSLGRDIVPRRTYKNKQAFIAIDDLLDIPKLKAY